MIVFALDCVGWVRHSVSFYQLVFVLNVSKPQRTEDSACADGSWASGRSSKVEKWTLGRYSFLGATGRRAGLRPRQDVAQRREGKVCVLQTNVFDRLQPRVL